MRALNAFLEEVFVKNPDYGIRILNNNKPENAEISDDTKYRKYSPLGRSAFMYMNTNSPESRKEYVNLILKLSSPPYDQFFPWILRDKLTLNDCQ